MTPLQAKALHLLQTTKLTNKQIGEQVGCDHSYVATVARTQLTPTEHAGRKRTNYSSAKTGAKSSNFKGGVSEYGYMVKTKPDWYTKVSGSQQVFEHVLVACQSLGITELPPGYIVHHIDEDKLNNNPLNLIVVTRKQHVLIHAQMRVNLFPPTRTIVKNWSEKS